MKENDATFEQDMAKGDNEERRTSLSSSPASF